MIAVRGYVADDGSLWSHDSELRGAGASHVRVPLVSLRDAEREIAARDAQIARLQERLEHQVEIARAEVPEWCRDILVLLAKAERWKGYQARKKRSELVRELVAELTHDQLRACGIEVP